MSGAVASALAGAGLISVSYVITLLVALLGSRLPGTAAAPLLAMTYLVKVLVLGWVLFNVPAPAWLRPGWLAAGVLAALAGWLALAAATAARASRRAREELERDRAAQDAPAETPTETPTEAPADTPVDEKEGPTA
jgi:hypothetical protein